MNRSRRLKRAPKLIRSETSARSKCTACGERAKGRTRAKPLECVVLRLDGWTRGSVNSEQLRKLQRNLQEFVEQHLRTQGAARAAAALSAEEPDCVVALSEYRILDDEHGNPYLARCDFYECDDGTTFWNCIPV